MHFKRRLLAFFLVAAFPLAVHAAPADEVKALLDQGKAAEAYAAGKKFPDELGNPAFDFYFGVAAVDSGHAGEGVLALERYVANFPDNVQARLELARGYFILGDDVRAREEFDAVLKTNPPPNVQANIQRFLDAIRSRESRYQTTAGFFAELGIGHDSNVNGGVSSANITLPVFGNVTITGTGVATADNFTHLAFGGNITHPVAPGVSLFGSANWESKLNHNDTEFDQNNYGVAGGVTYLREKNLFRGTFTYSNLEVENDRFRNVTGVSGEIHHQYDELQTLSGFVQLAELDYVGTNRVRDSRFYALGAGYRKAFVAPYQPLLTLNLTYGREDNIRNRPDLGREFYGLRAAVAATPAPKWALSVGATVQESRYDGIDPLLLTLREDLYYAADVTASYAFTRNVSVRGEYQYVKNDSNLALFEYDRNLFAVKLRYEFK
ncbi:MAG: outer membrane beta-barrel protein [Betaproteobacteria bacterium]|nr:outer membrane beta-barrel protein [Betaproteobacteria bacterium]